MSTRQLAFVAVAALLVAAPAASGTRADPTAKSVPRLAVVDRAPLTLRGTNFIRRERVRVFVRIDERTTARSLRANARGTFVVVFRDVALGHPCSGEAWWAQAAGARGSFAIMKPPPHPLCPPPLRQP